MDQKTVFIDLDGTLVVHNYNPCTQRDLFLPGSIEKLKEWKRNGCVLVLTTHRSQYECVEPLGRLSSIGIRFDRILFDLPTGPRIVINDCKKDVIMTKARAYNIARNEGIGGIEL